VPWRRKLGAWFTSSLSLSPPLTFTLPLPFLLSEGLNIDGTIDGTDWTSIDISFYIFFTTFAQSLFLCIDIFIIGGEDYSYCRGVGGIK